MHGAQNETCCLWRGNFGSQAYSKISLLRLWYTNNKQTASAQGMVQNLAGHKQNFPTESTGKARQQTDHLAVLEACPCPGCTSQPPTKTEGRNINETCHFVPLLHLFLTCNTQQSTCEPGGRLSTFHIFPRQLSWSYFAFIRVSYCFPFLC